MTEPKKVASAAVCCVILVTAFTFSGVGYDPSRSAYAHGDLTQSVEPPFVAGAGIFPPSASLSRAQEFTATGPIQAVDLLLYEQVTTAGVTDSVKVNIRSGSPTGTIVSSVSRTLTVTGNFDFLGSLGNPRVEHFDFPSPAALTSGNHYFIQVQSTNTAHPDGVFGWYVRVFDSDVASADPYSGGEGYMEGVPCHWDLSDPSICIDFGFRIYSPGTTAPDFKMSITPATQTVGLTGSSSFDISVTGSNGFDAQVELKVKFLPSDPFDDNLSSAKVMPGQKSILKFTVPNKTPTGVYDVVVTGASGGLVHTEHADLTVSRIKGVKNTVTINKFTVSNSGFCYGILSSSCFSIQQNFRINTGEETLGHTYFAQNVILVRTTGAGGIQAAHDYQIFNSKDPNTPVACSPGIAPHCTPQFSQFKNVKLATPITITSEIVGSRLVISSDLGSFSVPLQGLGWKSFINIRPDGRPPELAIVGQVNDQEATFKWPTSGSVQSFIKFQGGTNWSNSNLQVILGTINSPPDVPIAATGESSKNLRWTIKEISTVAFRYVKGAIDQGVRYPD